MTSLDAPSTASECFGILAGNGVLPMHLADALRKRSIPFVVAGLMGQAAAVHFPFAVEFKRFGIGAVEDSVNFFQTHGVRKIFFAGGVTRSDVWRYLRPDRVGARLLRSALLNGDNTLLMQCAAAYVDLGLEVIDPAPLFSDLFVETGLLAGPPPALCTFADLTSAREAALQNGSRDLGQAALARNGVVLGLEDHRGTDALIRSRGRPGASLVKMVKPAQDRRFDLPAVGTETIETARRAGLSAVGVEASGVLVLDKAAVYAACDAHGISFVGLTVDAVSEVGCSTIHGNAP